MSHTVEENTEKEKKTGNSKIRSTTNENPCLQTCKTTPPILNLYKRRLNKNQSGSVVRCTIERQRLSKKNVVV